VADTTGRHVLTGWATRPQPSTLSGDACHRSFSRTDPDNTLRTVISHADGQLTIELKGTRADSGDVVIRGRIGGHEFTISPKQDEPHMTVVLAPAEREVLKPWQGIASSLEAAQCSVMIDAYDTFRDNCEPPPCH
jgi:hypothetical protein